MWPTTPKRRAITRVLAKRLEVTRIRLIARTAVP
jgi:hypothetical protein